MRLGIFGGTFDPVHQGHLLLADQCREQCRLDAVWFVPAGVPPHKQSQSITAGKHRKAMLEMAVAGDSRFAIDDRELLRIGPSYTVDTLREIAAEDPQRELFLLLGADMLADLPNWRDPMGIASLATVVAVNRGTTPAIPGPQLTAVLTPAAIGRIVQVFIPGVEFSASDIRGRVRERRSIRFFVPRAVEQYIASHRLYAPGA